MNNFAIKEQDIISGSSRLISKNNLFDKLTYSLENMEFNLAYIEEIKRKNTKDLDKKILNNFKNKFQSYRDNWKNFPKSMYAKKIEDYNYFENSISGPLCVDIETASICDLACPHCFREYILTPDKIMDFNTYKEIINEITNMGVPSIKLNWRGEPLLNPQIGKFIKYAKSAGILEVAINTNATKLDDKMSETLISAGLDSIIYSFDGGTKKTYEKMRPGRFNKNKFEDVYKNIKNFSILKKKMKAKFPVTKIQMVLTDESRNEIDDFYNLFGQIVDDVTVTPYSERGGNLNDLKKNQKNKLINYLKKNNLPLDTKYSVEAGEKISVAIGRRSCDQIFQRVMITYDGRVAMCCMDWGAQHCIGYINKKAFDIKKTLEDLKSKIDGNKKGFELLKNAQYPKEFNNPPLKTDSIKNIWNGKEINKVRNIHKKNQLDKISICKACDFKDTYVWKEIE